MKSSFFCLLLAPAALAQVVFRPNVLRSRNLEQLDTETERINFPTFSLPPQISNSELRKEQEQRQEALGISTGVFQFGKAFEVELTGPDGLWHQFSDGSSVWRLGIKSATALSLNLIFSDFQLPEGAELYVRSSRGEVVGPFTWLNNKEHGVFSIAPMAGNELVLEYFVPEKVGGFVPFKIVDIVHGYIATPLTHPEDQQPKRSGSCNIDVSCKDAEDWQDQVRSVAMMMTSRGTGYCSGSMLNNIKQDGRQLFLTAHHCSTNDVSSDMLLFNFQAKSCGSRAQLPGKNSAAGLKKLANNRNSDFAIFEVEENIPESYNVYLSGWSAQLAPYVPEMMVGIHHPSADMKKISFADIKASETCWGSCSGNVKDHWKIDQWTKATTEPGSSGSPLFDSNKRVCGQLHGGSASCYNSAGYDVYGKLTSSFTVPPLGQLTTLQKVLDPNASGAFFMDGANLNDCRKRDFVFVNQE